jgi:hypothetical protein
MHLKQGKNYSASPETIDMTGFFKKSCITTRTSHRLPWMFQQYVLDSRLALGC